jgi:hypothetical protein
MIIEVWKDGSSNGGKFLIFPNHCIKREGTATRRTKIQWKPF